MLLTTSPLTPSYSLSTVLHYFPTHSLAAHDSLPNRRSCLLPVSAAEAFPNSEGWSWSRRSQRLQGNSTASTRPGRVTRACPTARACLIHYICTLENLPTLLRPPHSRIPPHSLQTSSLSNTSSLFADFLTLEDLLTLRRPPHTLRLPHTLHHLSQHNVDQVVNSMRGLSRMELRLTFDTHFLTCTAYYLPRTICCLLLATD